MNEFFFEGALNEWMKVSEKQDEFLLWVKTLESERKYM